MVFTSHIFLFYFLPAVILGYYVLPQRWRNGFLTLVSYVFYGWWKPWFVTLMLASTLIDYLAVRVMAAPGASPRRRKLALLASLVSNLGLLGVFKYAMFAQGNALALSEALGLGSFPVLEITLPIGISFYTFQTMSYSIDVYRGEATPVRRFGDFACFVALFPQLVAGPIVRFQTLANQLRERAHSFERFASGVALFSLGFGKKILLANPVGELADAAFAADHPGALAAWFGIVAYAFQIYFDFSGYSDMAIGLGRMFGFEFPKNFDSPYHSQSITEFWRRWHISLSTWLRDYLYLPLGGNRLGPRRTYVNLALVMLLGGLWHGAHWQFVVWGAYHGLLLGAERALGKSSAYRGLPKPLRIALTFVLVLISWVPFRANTLTEAGHYLGAMFGLREAGAPAALLMAQLLSAHSLLIMAICTGVVAMRTQSWDFVEAISRNEPGVRAWARLAVAPAVLLTAVAAMFTQAFNPFLYFQF
ncbi:MAG: MBOAT family protein [Myxococcales bacterium]|nr:MBOAT family protein [Myxococcales bacterium]